MNKLSVVFLLLLFPLFLEAASYKKIVVASFKTDSDAQRVLDSINEKIASDKSIVALQKKYEFEFVARPSGRYYIVAVEPFSNTNVLHTILNNIQLLYPDAYVNSVKLKDTQRAKEKKSEILEKKEADDASVIEIVDETEQFALTSSSSSKSSNADEKRLHVSNTVTSFSSIQSSVSMLEQLPSVSDGINTTKNKDVEEVGTTTPLLIFSMLFIIVLLLLMYLKEKMNAKKLVHSVGELERHAKMQKLFLTKISHELRRSVNSINKIGFLLLDTKLTDNQKEQIDTIMQSGESLIYISNDILDYERLYDATFTLNASAFNLDELCLKIGDKLKPQAKEKSLEVIFDIDSKVPINIIGDSTRLEQVLVHLLSNAIKFTHEGSIYLHVLSAEIDTSHVNILFEVKDSGIGIEKERIDSIFSLYKTSAKEDCDNNITTGISLAISKQLVEAMGGTLRVKSVFERGSSFLFSLSFELQHPNEKRQYHLPSDQLMQKRILIVDTNRASLEALNTILKYFHYSVESVQSIVEAEHKLKENRYDILFIDEKKCTLLHAEDIGQLKKLHHFKLVLIEAVSNQAIVNKEEFAFVDTLLAKPYSKQVVMDVIIELLGENAISMDKQISKKRFIQDLTASHILLSEDNEINQKSVELDVVNENVESPIDTADKELFFEILDDFVTVYSASAYDLKVFIEDNDLDEAHRLARNIKGISATIGAEVLANIGAKMESCFKEKNLDTIDALLQEYTVELDKVLILIKSYREL